MASPLLLYESLDVIGNGSFGIIRKVRRKSDGGVFARKELNFERMSERDRKQIVAEVNILKDLHHEHIVRYHDRYVDRDAGILYIVMEYCGGGDLSTVIKQAQRSGRPIPEDTIWNYFMQILLALNHCHHPNGHGRSSSTGSASGEEGKERRPQILHRDLKPDNVFLDESNTVKLGDFGLSKALAQTTFANTYVGTPYYMSPELMQEKAYDSKSDIWSLGCVIYELCALKPPFAEAKTHSELSILIRNGRIPPLPKGYSPALTSVIKAMLNLNPAMRPSASQLLQHERLTLAHKVSETEKLLATVKAHKATVQTKERDLLAREAHLTHALTQKDSELASLRALLSTAEETHQTRVREALLAREEELKAIVVRKEAELAARLAKREEEVMEAVNKREQEVARSWAAWEVNVRSEVTRAVDERMDWVQKRADDLERERERLDGVKREVEIKIQQLEKMELMSSERRATASIQDRSTGILKAKTPLEEVKNILAPLARLAEPTQHQHTPIRHSRSSSSIPPVFETPMSRAVHARFPSLEQPSAMKGVILTHTGESLPTPSPAELANLFVTTPKVSLNFAQIFDFESDVGESDDEGPSAVGPADGSYDPDARVPTPSSQSEESTPEPEDVQRTPTQTQTQMQTQATNLAARPTRLRRPSIRTSVSREALRPPPTATTESISIRKKKSSREPLSTMSSTSRSTAAMTATTTISANGAPPSKEAAAAPKYDLSDEENLPSPFLKKVDRERITRTSSVPAHAFPIQGGAGPGPIRTAGRKSGGTLRALAVVNAANAANNTQVQAPGVGAAKKGMTVKSTSVSGARTSVVKARGAGEDARKVLHRP